MRKFWRRRAPQPATWPVPLQLKLELQYSVNHGPFTTLACVIQLDGYPAMQTRGVLVRDGKREVWQATLSWASLPVASALGWVSPPSSMTMDAR